MRLILPLLLLIGVADSSYLLYTHYMLHISPYCPVDCLPPDLPFPSYYFALLGLLWFLVGIIVCLLVKIKRVLKIWQILGFLGAISLLLYSISIKYFCPYCYLAHFLGILSVIISWKFKT
ncbi:MAG: hypothetical protein QXR27_00915 [Archaeoglobaceae archaeon]